MIMRIWRGKVPTPKADSYLAYLHETGLADYRNVAGNLGVFATTRNLGEATEFVLVTYWESVEAIRRFAGDPIDTAVYYPADDDYLLYREPKVEHYEVRYAAHALP
jgi:heme-degrading monooxygenase HmoA